MTINKEELTDTQLIIKLLQETKPRKPHPVEWIHTHPTTQTDAEAAINILKHINNREHLRNNESE